MTGVYCVYYRGCRASEQEVKKVRVCGGKMEGLGFFGFFVWVLGLFFSKMRLKRKVALGKSWSVGCQF